MDIEEIRVLEEKGVSLKVIHQLHNELIVCNLCEKEFSANIATSKSGS
jgi:hypothetical protein